MPGGPVFLCCFLKVLGIIPLRHLHGIFPSKLSRQSTLTAFHCYNFISLGTVPGTVLETESWTAPGTALGTSARTVPGTVLGTAPKTAPGTAPRTDRNMGQYMNLLLQLQNGATAVTAKAQVQLNTANS